MLDDGAFAKFEIGAWTVDGMVKRTISATRTLAKVGVVVASFAASGVIDASTMQVLAGKLVSQTESVFQWKEPLKPDRPGYDAKAVTQPLKKLRELKFELQSGAIVNRQAIRTARIVAHQIESRVEPSIGIDEDGSIFLHFVQNRKHAYLTIDADAYHLLCIVPGESNYYIDDERLTGKKLPQNIQDKIASLFS